MTYLDLAKKYFPQASDEELDYILWEYTGFPSFYRDLGQPESQLKAAQKKFKNFKKPTP